jgi:hypothetical protein
MKKAAFALLVALAPYALAASEPRWEAGLSAGMRTIKDETLRTVYGNGFVYTPFVSLKVSPKVAVGLEFEGGYVKDAKIGIFREDSRLAVQGGSLFVSYGRDKGLIRPFLKFGAGIFHFQMDIESPYVQAYNFSANDISILVAGGFKASLSRTLFLSAEMKYSALWADPFDDMVDLGGIRLLLGAGVRL